MLGDTLKREFWRIVIACSAFYSPQTRYDRIACEYGKELYVSNDKKICCQMSVIVPIGAIKNKCSSMPTMINA